MRGLFAWILTFALSAALGAAAGLPAAHAARAPDRADQLEQSIEEARKELDEAARRLARLHSELWRLETTGPRSQRPMLGILVDDSGSEDGLVLVGVTPEGGAEEAGLKAGDRIVMVNGVRLDGREGGKALHYLFTEALDGVEPGDRVAVAYVRDGETRHAEILTRERGSYMARVVEEQQPWLEALQSLQELEDLEALQGLEELEVLKGGKLDLSGDVTRVPAGLELIEVAGPLGHYFGVERGVLVLEAPAGAGLEPGDILLRVGGEPVPDAQAALARLAGAKGELPVEVRRRGRQRELALDAGALNAEQALQVVQGGRRIRIQRRYTGEQVRLEITVDE